MKVRRKIEPQLSWRGRFNSRTREGATKTGSILAFFVSFNSRTREGATTCADCGRLAREVSIHAPVKVRLCTVVLMLGVQVSIHAPVKVRLWWKQRRIDTGCFNSRTREGATFP